MGHMADKETDMTNAKDTMEYWVHLASKGDNPAVCWQQCNRILEEKLREAREEAYAGKTGHEVVNIIRQEERARLREAVEAIDKKYSASEDHLVQQALSEVKQLLDEVL